MLLEHSSHVNLMLFYDQLGCGKSSPPSPEILGDGHSMLTQNVMDLIEVVHYVKSHHPTHRICVLGHSWGGQLVLEYLLQQGAKDSEISCAVVSNAPLDENHYKLKEIEMRNNLDEAVRSFYVEDERALAENPCVQAQIYRKLIGCSITNITGEMQGGGLFSPSPRSTYAFLASSSRATRTPSRHKTMWSCSENYGAVTRRIPPIMWRSCEAVGTFRSTDKCRMPTLS